MRLIPTALALCLACGAASAQWVPEQPRIEPGLLSVYSEYDANGDGQVSTNEFVALLPPELQSAGRQCDTNGDGVFTTSEYDACTNPPPPAGEPQAR